MWGALSDERTGLSFTIAAGPRQHSHFRIRVLWDLRPYFTVSDSRLPFLSPPTTRRATVEVFDPASTRDPMGWLWDFLFIYSTVPIIRPKMERYMIGLTKMLDNTENRWGERGRVKQTEIWWKPCINMKSGLLMIILQYKWRSRVQNCYVNKFQLNKLISEF
jgi:hypothetical protein